MTAQQKKVALEDMLALAVEMTGDGIWDWHVPSGDCRFLPAWRQILGYSEAEVVPSFSWLTQLLHDADRDHILRRLEAHLAGETPMVWEECRMRCADQSYKWVVLRCRVLEYDAEGAPLHVVGTQTDISMRKRAEQLAQEGAEHYRALTELLPLPMLIHAAGIIKYLNNACVSLFRGDSRDEFIGTSILQVIHPDYRAAALERVQRILQGEPEVEAVELKLMLKDGSESWIETSGIAVPFAGEQCIYVVGKDINDRKRIEEQERKRLADMESLYKLSNMVTTLDSLEDMYQVAMDAVMHTLRADRVSILLFDSEGVMRFVAWRGLSATYRTAAEGHSPWTQNAVNPQPLFVEDIEREENLLSLLPVASQEGIRALGFVPLVHHGHLIGKFMLYFNQPHAITEAESQLAQTIAFHIALGVERKHSEEEIYNLAFYDPLTKLPNRRLLYDRIQHSMAIGARQRQHGALLFIDLDYFKTLNDTRGHQIGDSLLSEVACRLQKGVREFDTVARLGGDEFVALLEELSPDHSEAAAQAEQVAQKLRSILNYPHELQGQECHSTPSIGITLFRGHDESIDALLKHADIAMYQAKAAGRNTVRFYDEAMQLKLEARMEMENALRKALPEGQFQLYYQPQVDSSRRIIGVEALIRWHHPERGMISPTDFIPLAEETGLILPIGEWVLQTACAQIGAWSGCEKKGRLRISVNVSSLQFEHEGFVGMVRTALYSSGIDPTCIKLELTESMMMHNLESAVGKMYQIKALGVGCAMDDFGTGFSSLSYLKRLPLDQIKIDQSFVRDLVSDHNDKAIIQAIITMGDAFDLDIIAEGVETEEQRAELSRNGCALFQGYLFGAPMPVEQLNQILLAAGD